MAICPSQICAVVLNHLLQHTLRKPPRNIHMRGSHMCAVPPFRVGGSGHAARVNLGLLDGVACEGWRGAARTDWWRAACNPPSSASWRPTHTTHKFTRARAPPCPAPLTGDWGRGLVLATFSLEFDTVRHAPYACIAGARAHVFKECP